jgi:hypothetical protein
MPHLFSYLRWRIRTELNLIRRKRARKVRSDAAQQGWETRREREKTRLRRGAVA